jgi:hypothetical protein
MDRRKTLVQPIVVHQASQMISQFPLPFLIFVQETFAAKRAGHRFVDLSPCFCAHWSRVRQNDATNLNEFSCSGYDSADLFQNSY